MEAPRQLTFGEESFTASPRTDVLCLFLFTAMVSLWGLSSGPGLSDHEAIVPLGARSIRQGGDWLIPKVGNEEFIRKPPLAFWLTTLSSMVVDPAGTKLVVSPMAARFPSALASIGTTLLVYALGRSMFGHRRGLVCGAVLSASVGTFFFSHNGQVEMVLTFFMTAAMACFWFGTEGTGRRRVYLALFYVCFAMAMMAKAPLPFAMIGLPLMVWWFGVVPLAKLTPTPQPPEPGVTLPPSRLSILRGQVSRLRELWLLPGVLLFLLLFLPWPIYVYFKIPHAMALWDIEFVERYSGELSGKDHAVWYYLLIAMGLVFPFTLSLPEAILSPVLRVYHAHRKGLLFALTWAVVQTAFLSTSAFKRPHYLIGCAPALALLLGPSVDRLFLSAWSFSRRMMWAAVGLIGLALAAGLGYGAYVVRYEYAEVAWSFRLGAIIFAVGVVASCVAFLKRDRVLSLMVLLAASALTFAWSWDAIGQGGILDTRVSAMMEELRARSIGRVERITWAIGRPDSRLMYYMGLDIQQLFTPLELAPKREGRQTIPQDLLQEGAERMRARLLTDQKEYFVLKGKYWDRLKDSMDLPAREVFRAAGEWNDPKNDWVVVTNAWNMLPAADVDSPSGGP